MKRIASFFLCFALFGTVFAGCAATPAESAGAQTVTFVDSLGRTVTAGAPVRVGAAMGSFAEGWLLAGGELVAATEDATSERGITLPKDAVSLGSMKTPSVEAILSADLDLLLLSSDIAGQVDLADTLDQAGVPTAYFSVETFDDYLVMLKTFTAITGRPDLYEQNGTAVKAQVNAAIARCTAAGKEPKILLLRAYSTGVKAKGSDNMTGAMLADLGCLNIAQSDTSLLEELNLESIVTADPDFIFITTMGASDEAAMASFNELLGSNPAFAALTAVTENRCILLEKKLFHYKPNARWGESYEKLADILCADD